MSCLDTVCGTGGWAGPKPGDPDNTSILSAVGISGGNSVTWTYPLTNPYAVAYVEIFRSDSNQVGTAVKRATVSGDSYFDRIPSNEIHPYFYWIKITSVNGTVGEMIGPASATPSDSIQEVLAQISGILDDSYLDQTLRAKIDKIQQIEFDLGAEVSKRLLQNATMGEALSAVQSETGQALAYIQSEITQRTDSDEALLNSVNSLAVGMADNAAALVEEQTVRATADSALASDITALYSNVAANTSAISSEATTRANAVSSMATTINSVTAVANAKNKTFSQAAAPTIGMDAGDLWFDTDDGNKPYRYSGTAWVATDDARIAANMASISNEATARANADTAIASSVTNLVSAVASKIKTYRQTTEPTVGMSLGDVWFDSDDGNKMYRYDGASWIATDDSRIASNVAAIANEAATRATADTALATSISTIQTQLSSDGVTGSAIIQAQTTANTAVTDARTAQTTADSKVKTFFQATAPTASTVGDLWVDTDDNNHIYRWSGVSWIDAHDARISSTASTVTALQTTVGDHTAAIQTAASSIDGLTAQYTVKVDNNGYISGFGLASTPKDGTPYSEFAVLANTFKIGAPDGTKTPFAVVDTGGGVYKTLLNSDVLIGGNVDIANLTTGSLPNNVKLSLGGGVIDLDGAGEIRVFKSLDENADYVRLSAGELRFLRYVGGSYQTYNFLSRLETGIANSGSSVKIPGYWKVQPKVMVSPAMMNLYKKDYGNQDQAINCQALNIRETAPGSGQWMFDANATLSLAVSSGGTALNISSGAISSNTFTTATQTTPANCTSITPSFSLSSSRGNGSSQYYHRSVRWRVEYFNGSVWVNGVWSTLNMGDQFGSVAASGTFNFPSAGTWQWRISYEAFDTDGTVFGAVSFSYTEETVNAPDINSTITLAPNSYPAQVTSSFGSPTGSGEIYEITYNISPTVKVRTTYPPGPSFYRFSIGHSFSNGNTKYINTSNYNQQDAYTGVVYALGKTGCVFYNVTSTFQQNAFGIHSLTFSGNNLVFNNKFWSLASEGNSSQSAIVVGFAASGITALVKRRSINTNSTIPANTFIVNSYTYALIAAQVLATGSMNWMAVGE